MFKRGWVSNDLVTDEMCPPPKHGKLQFEKSFKFLHEKRNPAVLGHVHATNSLALHFSSGESFESSAHRDRTAINQTEAGKFRSPERKR